MAHAPKCLKCGETLPFHDAIGEPNRKPSNGDIAICFECGEAMIFSGKAFRLPTKEEFAEMLQDEEFAAALAAVAVKNSRYKATAGAVILDPETGHATVLAEQPHAICEMCDKLKELRPYGPRKPDGARMVVCFDCAQKDEAEAMRAFEERLEGRNPV